MGKFKDNPWLGLESYQENQIIYGRDNEIKELSQRVLSNNVTVLFGKSGIGKSSIINAGIIPNLRVCGYTPIVIRLDHNNKHSYIKQLSEQIEKNTKVSKSTVNKLAEEELLWEYFHTHYFTNGDDNNSKSKLVIIFDQFEEIFTLQNKASNKEQFFKEIADVINDVMPKSLSEASNNKDSISSKTHETSEEHISGFTGMTDLFSSIAERVKGLTNNYIDDNEIHFIFTLREDFLSEFEYYTSKIPSLKQHRYGLRPINEIQASEIILKPRSGLVDENVAKLIIQTITGHSDFSFDNSPRIEVDAAVLSLFLNQIYDKREEKEDTISLNLVKTFGKDIIKDFYEESINGLTKDQIAFLEEELLTGENRRDSLSKSDFMAGGFSEKEVQRLIEEKKLLRQFHYGNDIRIEFIHDILCPVVKDRKEARIQDLKLENERKIYAQKIKKQKRLYKYAILGLSIISILVSFFGFHYYKSNNLISVNVNIKESENIKDDDFWRSQIIVQCAGDTLYDDIIDKVNSNFSFEINKSLRDNDLEYKVIPLVGNIREATEYFSLSESSNITIVIEPKTKENALFGKIHVSSGSVQPVMGAVVIWGSQVTKTTNKGYFSFNEPIDYSFNKEAYNSIKIIKEGYKLTEHPIKENGSIYTFDLENKDLFYSRCKEIESIDTTKYKKMVFEGDYYLSEKSNPLVINTYFINDSTIQGYYYYKNFFEKRKYRKETLYILFNGIITNDKFIITSTDDAFNKRTVVGKLINNNMGIEGEAFSSGKLYDFKLDCKTDLRDLVNITIGHK